MNLNKLKKQDLKEFFKYQYGKYPPSNFKKKDIITVLSHDIQTGAGIKDFFRSKANSTFSFLKKGYNKVKDTFKPVQKIEDTITKPFDYRTRLTNESRKTLEEVGDKVINNITIIRTPVNKTLVSILDTLSFGYFKQLMENHGFDKFFHLALVLSIDGRYVILEKLAEVNISFNYKKSYTELSEATTVENYQGGLTLNQMVNKTREFMGDKLFFDYDAFTNNCQNFIMSVLTANGLDNQRNKEFVFQDIKEIYNELEKKASYLSPFAKMTTRLGAWWNKLTGAGQTRRGTEPNGGKNQADILTKKKPINYGIETNEIIKMLSFNYKNVEVMGSSAIKATLYPSDFDLYEVVKVKNLEDLENKFQDKILKIVQSKNIYLGDVKIGVFPEYEILKDNIYFKNNRLIGYHPQQIKKDIKNKLYFLPKQEKQELLKLIKAKPTPDELDIIKDKLRYHILRWTPEEILKGLKLISKIKGSRRLVDILDAFKSDGLFKVDVVAFTRNKFIDFSIIYELRDEKTNKRINNFMVNVKDNLNDQIRTYKIKGQYFKALKREFSKLKHTFTYTKNKETKERALRRLKELTTFFNGQAGIIYSVINDIEALLNVIKLSESEYSSNEKIINVIQSFIYRLSNIYSVNEYLRNEKNILLSIKAILRNPENMEENLEQLKNILFRILNKFSKSI